MNGNKRSLSVSRKATSTKRTRLEVITGPAANTRSKSREKNKENVDSTQNMKIQVKHENCDKSKESDNVKSYHQPAILKRNSSDKKDVRKPLIDKNVETSDRTAKFVNQNLNRINRKTVVIKYYGTCNGPCSSSCQGNCSQNNIKRTVNVIQSNSDNVDKNQFIAHFPLVTVRDSKLNLKPDEIQDFKNFKTFSNDNLATLENQQNECFKSLKVTHRGSSYNDEKKDDFDTLVKSEIVILDSNTISYKHSIFVDNNSPFQERKRSNKVIINDGIPSLRKKTLKRDVFKASGVKGVIDLDPNLSKVHVKLLYSEYLNDLLQISLKRESKYILPRDFITRKSNLTHPRSMLINWLLKIQQFYKSDHGTFFISIQLFDRILNLTEVSIDNIQLIGIVTYWIATKWNDIISIPKANELVQLCKKEVTIQELLKTEQKVLRFIKFDLTLDEPMIFVRYYLYNMQIENCDILAFCANYLLDCFTLNMNFGLHSFSLQAATAVYLSLQLFNLSTQYWDRLKNLPGYYSPIDLLNLRGIMLQMMQIVQDPEYEFREPFLKYKSEKYGAISVRLLEKQVAT